MRVGHDHMLVEFFGEHLLKVGPYEYEVPPSLRLAYRLAQQLWGPGHVESVVMLGNVALHCGDEALRALSTIAELGGRSAALEFARKLNARAG